MMCKIPDWRKEKVSTPHAHPTRQRMKIGKEKLRKMFCIVGGKRREFSRENTRKTQIACESPHIFDCVCGKLLLGN